MSCLDLYHVPSSLVCRVYFMLCSIVSLWYFIFCLSFIFSYILHPYASLPLFISSFFSLLPFDSFVYSWQKGREYTREYTEVYRHLYMTHVRKHLYLWLWGRNSTSCTFVERESHRRDVYTMGEETFLWENLVLLCFSLRLFSRCFMVLWVMFSIYTLLLSSHHVYALDMHTSLCHYALLVACLHDHLLCYVVIVVISIWLSCVWSSCSYVSHLVYLISYLLVTLYLSFDYFLYLEGLIRFVQVFQVIGIVFQVYHKF